MISGITIAIQTILHLLAQPYLAFRALDFYDWQLPLLIIAILLLGWYPLSAYLVVGIDVLQEYIKDAAFDRQWDALAAKTQEEYDQLYASMKDEAGHAQKRATRFQAKALENRFPVLPGARASLNRAANKSRANHTKILSRMQRVAALWQEITDARKQAYSGVRQTLSILQQIDSSNEKQALQALATLNRVHADWMGILSNRLQGKELRVAVRCLEICCSTNNLHEARTHYAHAMHILRQAGVQWTELAA
jgi:hypothetical protein